MGNYKFADIVINRPIEGPFTYSIPESLKQDLELGSVVEVSFGNKVVIGYVVGFSDKCDIERLKPINSIIDKSLTLSSEMLELTKWISKYYYSSWGEAISAAIPSVLKKKPTTKKHKKEKKDKEDEEFEFIDGSEKHLMPNPEQQEALDLIINSIDDKKHKVFLLHGVTGSGKTEVYLQSIGHAMELGLSSIVLVPEISLTPQTVGRFKARFAGKIAVLY